MKKMAAGAFKANRLAVMDEVQSKHETVVITKHGKPVAKLVPVEPQGDDIFGFLRGNEDRARWLPLFLRTHGNEFAR